MKKPYLRHIPATLTGILLTLVLPAAGLLLSCQKPANAAEEAVVLTAVEPLRAPQQHQAVITFLSGEVLLDTGGGWESAAIGAYLSEKDRLKVERDAFCEIQFGKTALVRVQENTEIAMETLYLQASRVKIGIKMKVGGLLTKVSRISTGEEFTLRTSSVAVGVRGTVFLLREREGEQPTVAVKEGKVAVTSASLDVGALRDRVAEKDTDLRDRIDELEKAFVLVDADQELTLDLGDLRKTADEYENLAAAVERVLQGMEQEGATEASEEDLAVLETAVSAVVKTAGAEYGQPKSITAENALELEAVEKAEFLDLPGASEDEERQPADARLVRIAVAAEPADSVILLADRVVGRGTAAGVFSSGVKLRLAFRREGYKEQTLEIDVTAGADAEYRINLQRVEAEEKQPSAGTGDTQAAAADRREQTSGERETRLDQREDAADQRDISLGDDGKEPDVRDGDGRPDKGKSRETIKVVTEPQDAEILLDGRFVGRGTAQRQFDVGATIVVMIRRPGFREQRLELEITPGSGGTYHVVLEPDPIIMYINVSDAPLTGSVVTDRWRIVGVDGEGTIIVYDKDKNLIKRYPTEQHTVGSVPLLRGIRISFVGHDRLFVLAADTAELINATPLKDPSLIPGGRRPIPFQGRGLFTDAGRLVSYDLIRGGIVGNLPIPAGLIMNPVPFADSAVVINTEGIPLLIEGPTAIEPLHPEPILPDAAVLASIQGSRIAALGLDGSVVCFDIETRRVLWESRMPFDPDPDMPLAMEYSPDVLYIWSGPRLFGWLSETGEILFPAIEGVSSPPLFQEGFLAFGTDDGRLVIADAFSGRYLRVLDLGERVTARPWIEEGNIVIGTDQGNIFVINPDAIR